MHKLIWLTLCSTYHRISKTCVATWIFHLHQHGTLMASHLRRVTKIRPAGSGTSANSRNLWRSWEATSEPFDLSGSRPMDGSWQRPSLLTLCTSLTWVVGTSSNKSLISLGRFQVCPSAQTLMLCSLGCGTERTGACCNTTAAGTIPTWTH